MMSLELELTKFVDQGEGTARRGEAERKQECEVIYFLKATSRKLLACVMFTARCLGSYSESLLLGSDRLQ